MSEQKKYIAFDYETHLIGPLNIHPKPVCLSYYDGEKANLLVGFKEIDSFFDSIPKNCTLIAHNLKFELGVTYRWFPHRREWIWRMLEEGRFLDTLVSEKLKDLAAEGEFNIKGYSLARLVQKYFQKDISALKIDGWRLRYSELEDVPKHLWPQDAIDYALMDSVYAYDIASLQKYTTENLSVCADFALSLCTSHGFLVDKKEVQTLKDRIHGHYVGHMDKLTELGFAEVVPKPKTPAGLYKKNTIALRDYILFLNSDASRTAKGSIKIDEKILSQYPTDEVALTYIKASKMQRILGSFIPNLEKATESTGILHPDFNIMVASGRTSSSKSSLYPSANLQQMPRDSGIRECFIAKPGYSLVSIDYSSLELHTIAQQLYTYLGHSDIGDLLNAGTSPVDLHSVTGARIMSLETGTDVSYEEFLTRKKEPQIKHYRLLAKVANLGFPGGLGIKKLIENAKATYGVDISEEQGAWLRELFFDEYKDLRTFMRVYSKQWETKFTLSIRDENDKIKKVPEYWYIVGDRVRRGCTYNAWANGFLMQSLAADGGKIAAYNVCQYLEQTGIGYLQGFIHDELIFSLKHSPQMHKEVETIAYMMCQAMRQVTPSVRITVEASIMGHRWSKAGPFEFEKTFWINKDDTKGVLGG